VLHTRAAPVALRCCTLRWPEAACFRRARRFCALQTRVRLRRSAAATDAAYLASSPTHNLDGSRDDAGHAGQGRRRWRRRSRQPRRCGVHPGLSQPRPLVRCVRACFWCDGGSVMCMSLCRSAWHLGTAYKPSSPSTHPHTHAPTQPNRQPAVCMRGSGHQQHPRDACQAQRDLGRGGGTARTQM